MYYATIPHNTTVPGLARLATKVNGGATPQPLCPYSRLWRPCSHSISMLLQPGSTHNKHMPVMHARALWTQGAQDHHTQQTYASYACPCPMGRRAPHAQDHYTHQSARRGRSNLQSAACACHGRGAGPVRAAHLIRAAQAPRRAGASVSDRVGQGDGPRDYDYGPQQQDCFG